MNAYERKLNGMRRENRRFMRLNKFLEYKTMRDYEVHFEAYMKRNFGFYKGLSRRWKRYAPVNRWKTCQQRHANKRIRNRYDNMPIDDELVLPRRSEYKKIHAMIIY